MNFRLGSLTPFSAQLNKLISGKGPGRLAEFEVELLRKSKKEVSAVRRKTFGF